MRARLLPLTVIALAGWLTSGCITSDTLVKVKPNGSGTIETTMLVNTALMKELGEMMGGGQTKTSMPTVKEFADQAAKMKGVRLVSQTPVSRDGQEGVTVVLAFDDINQITVDENLPGKGGSKSGEQVAFRLARTGPTSVLTVTFPDGPGEAKAGGGQTQNQPRQNQPKARNPSMGPEMLKMVAGFFKGLRVTIGVEVLGTLVKTSSPYVEGNRVTLLDMDMEQLFSQPAAMEQMESLIGPDASITEARAALEKAGVKGIKVNDPVVTIEFR